MAKKRKSYSKYHPRYWLTQLVLNSLSLLTKLPYTWQMALGRRLGRALQKHSSRMRRVTETNLSLCFPELTGAEKQQRLTASFESLGMGFFETLLAAWGNPKLLRQLTGNVEGLQAVQDSLSQGQGVILLFPHLVPMYFVGRLLLLHSQLPFSLMYHSPRDLALNSFMLNKLKRHCDKVFNRRQSRDLVKHLKNGNLVWYAPDLDLGKQQSEFVPFYNTPAATLTAPVRLAKLTGAKVFPISFYRRDELSGYDIKILPALESFPSDDCLQDLLKINRTVEQIINVKPEQYLWQYKRFSTRPAGEAKLY